MADPKFHSNAGAKTLQQLADICGADVDEAQADTLIQDVAPLDVAGDGDISFFDNVKYKEDFKNTKATACIVASQMAEFAPEGCVLLVSKTPYKSYALIAQSFYPAKTPTTNIHPKAVIAQSAQISGGVVIDAGAVIGEGAQLGENSWVEANAVIGENVKIGASCRIGAGAIISHTLMGDYSRIYPNANIGQDGFGFAIDPTGYIKVPQLGRVIIGNHVEIGSGTCIDRGAGPDTEIGDGTWIDNLVQIGHNVRIGKGCVIVSQVGIAGSATLEDYVLLGGQVGIAGHIKIASGTRVAAQSGVIKDTSAGAELMGSPALPIKQHLRQIATLKKLTK